MGDRRDSKKPACQTIQVNEGEVIVLRGEYAHEAVNAMVQTIRNQGVKNFLVLCLAPGQEIDHVSETEMNRFGWVRSPSKETH